MCESLDKLTKTDECKSKDIIFDVFSSEESSNELLRSLSFEGQVKYINGSPLNTELKCSSKKITENSELDLEITEFQNRLALAEALSQKPSPLCSDDFLGILRSRCLEARRKFLNN